MLIVLLDRSRVEPCAGQCARRRVYPASAPSPGRVEGKCVVVANGQIRRRCPVSVIVIPNGFSDTDLFTLILLLQLSEREDRRGQLCKGSECHLRFCRELFTKTSFSLADKGVWIVPVRARKSGGNQDVDESYPGPTSCRDCSRLCVMVYHYQRARTCKYLERNMLPEFFSYRLLQ